MGDINKLNKIAVVGSSGGGKTTVSRTIAKQFNIDFIGIDYICWQPNWVTIPDDDLRKIIDEKTAKETWVIDGNYTRLHDITLNRAEVIIWLNYSFIRVTSRVIFRTVKHIITREEILTGCRGYFLRSFISKDSIIWYVIKSWKKVRIKYRKIFDEKVFGDKVYIECRNQEELDRYLATLKP